MTDNEQNNNNKIPDDKITGSKFAESEIFNEKQEQSAKKAQQKTIYDGDSNYDFYNYNDTSFTLDKNSVCFDNNDSLDFDMQNKDKKTSHDIDKTPEFEKEDSSIKKEDLSKPSEHLKVQPQSKPTEHLKVQPQSKPTEHLKVQPQTKSEEPSDAQQSQLNAQQQPAQNAQQPSPNVQQPGPNVQQPGPNVQQPGPNVQQPQPNIQQQQQFNAQKKANLENNAYDVDDFYSYNNYGAQSKTEPQASAQQPGPNMQQSGPSVQQPQPNIQQQQQFNAQKKTNLENTAYDVDDFYSYNNYCAQSKTEPQTVTQQPGPNVQQPSPNVQQPRPNVQQPQPNVQQPGPNVQQPRPNTQQPQPNVQHPGPNVQQPRPNTQQRAQAQINRHKPAAKSTSNRKNTTITAFVLGIISVVSFMIAFTTAFFYFVFIGIITALIGFFLVLNARKSYRGPMVTAGFILNIIGLSFSALSILMFIIGFLLI